jgi:hypothetical protein
MAAAMVVGFSLRLRPPGFSPGRSGHHRPGRHVRLQLAATTAFDSGITRLRYRPVPDRQATHPEASLQVVGDRH